MKKLNFLVAVGVLSFYISCTGNEPPTVSPGYDVPDGYCLWRCQAGRASIDKPAIEPAGNTPSRDGCQNYTIPGPLKKHDWKLDYCN